MNVADIMTPAAVTDAPDDTLAEASAKMWQQQTGSLLVMQEGRLAGIVTERDVLRAVAEGHDAKAISLRDVMTTDVVTCKPDTSLGEAAQIMFEHWFRHLPVVDDGEVLGIISLRDLVTILAKCTEGRELDALQEITGLRLARDVRLERVEAGDLD